MHAPALDHILYTKYIVHHILPAHEQGPTILPIFRGSGPTPSPGKSPLQGKNQVQVCSNINKFRSAQIIIYVCLHRRVSRSHASSVAHLRTQVVKNVHLLAHRWKKVGLAGPVAVHNTPRVILTRIP